MVSNISIKDVARAAGVSISTVSSVMNNKGRISPDTRARVAKIIKDLGYIPHYAARNLKMERARALGFVVPWYTDVISSKYLREIVRGVSDVVEKAGYKLHFIGLCSGNDVENQLHRIVREKAISGIFILAPNQREIEVFQAALSDLSFIIIGSSLDDPKLNFVDSDNYDAGRKVTEHLIKMGHRKIAFVHTDIANLNTRHRLEGYLSMLKEKDWDIRKEYVLCLSAQEIDFGQITDLLKRGVTAIFAKDDFLAIKIMNYLMQAGYEIPHDVAIVGFDDEEFTTYFRPSLTTVRQPLIEMGVLAAQSLLQHIEKGGQDVENIIQKKLKTTLIIRESSGLLLK